MVREGESGAVIFAFIHSVVEEQAGEPRHERFPIDLMCELFGVTRQGYYAWRGRRPSVRDLEDEEITSEIVEIHRLHKGRLGIARLTVELAKAGRRCSPKRVRRLARAAGLACVHPRPWRRTTVQDRAARAGLVDLVGREFVPAGMNELWFTDITYIHTADGWTYLALIIDGYTRKIVGWGVDEHMRTGLVIRALDIAIWQQRPGIGQCVVHSDRGSQYTGAEFRDFALANGIIPSVGSTGICYDNAMAESINATVKKELVNLREWSSLAEVRIELFSYIEGYYNRIRPHSRLSGMAPLEKEEQAINQFDKEPMLTL